MLQVLESRQALTVQITCKFHAFVLELFDVVGVTLQLYDHGAATHRKGARAPYTHPQDATYRVLRSQGGVQFPTGGIARERLSQGRVSRSGETPGPTV